MSLRALTASPYAAALAAAAAAQAGADASLKIASNGGDILDKAAFRVNLEVAPMLTRTKNVGERSLLTEQPEEVVTVGTSTFSKNQWRFGKFRLDTAWAVDQLVIYTTTAASGGTAAARFGLFALDANGRPAVRQADYADIYGTLDLTAAPGALALSVAGLIIPAGEWAIGFGWDGTAGVNPIGYAVNGQALNVSSNALAPLTHAGYYSNQSGASTPNPATPSSDAVAGIAVWVRHA